MYLIFINPIFLILVYMRKIKSLRHAMRHAFDKKGILGISLTAFATKSLPFVWIVWDAILSNKLYKHQKFYPDQLLRFLRFGVGVGWFFGFLNPVTAGLLLVGDGIFSILRYRALNTTKDIYEDVPRLIRVGIGIMMFPVSF
ncbi:MAG: hypothetical protein ACTSV6_00635 [Candidatus Heimdallarchaeota archaeon]